jgi:hypothetical protein
MRGLTLVCAGGLLGAIGLACGGGESSVALPVAEPAVESVKVEAAAEQAPAAADAEAPKAATSELQCKEGLLVSYREILAKGCSFEITDGDLAMTYRVLRNAPFAARGRKFSSPELTAYFGSEAFCSGGGTYEPAHDSVTIDPGPELECIGKLKARETGLRQRGKQPMRTIEVYVLSNPEGGIQTEARRMAGHDVMESKATFNRVQSGWTLHFYSEWMEEEFKAESSVIVMCDPKGDNCETQSAG